MTKQELEELAQQLTNENEDLKLKLNDSLVENEDLKLKLNDALVEIEILNDKTSSPIEHRKGSFGVAV